MLRHRVWDQVRTRMLGHRAWDLRSGLVRVRAHLKAKSEVFRRILTHGSILAQGGIMTKKCVLPQGGSLTQEGILPQGGILTQRGCLTRKSLLTSDCLFVQGRYSAPPHIVAQEVL